MTRVRTSSRSVAVKAGMVRKGSETQRPPRSGPDIRGRLSQSKAMPPSASRPASRRPRRKSRFSGFILVRVKRRRAGLGHEIAGAVLGLLPGFLPPQRGLVEQARRPEHVLGGAAVARVGVEDFVAAAQEAAQAGEIERRLLGEIVAGAR